MNKHAIANVYPYLSFLLRLMFVKKYILLQISFHALHVRAKFAILHNFFLFKEKHINYLHCSYSTYNTTLNTYSTYNTMLNTYSTYNMTLNTYSTYNTTLNTLLTIQYNTIQYKTIHYNAYTIYLRLNTTY